MRASWEGYRLADEGVGLAAGLDERQGPVGADVERRDGAIVETRDHHTVITGGADSLCQFTVRGFMALESVASERCNPFSARRRGINIGEGAALFLMPWALVLLGTGALLPLAPWGAGIAVLGFIIGLASRGA